MGQQNTYYCPHKTNTHVIIHILLLYDVSQPQENEKFLNISSQPEET
jgi:hypothetical protein